MTDARPRGEAYVQSLFDEDRGAVPAALRSVSFADPGEVVIAPERYTSRAYHDLEVERMWHKVWQMACREEDIPSVGDYVVYDIADTSLIVMRSAPGRIQAFHNSCLHRGTQLRAGSGHSDELRCPFHGFTWRLDGSLDRIPCQWDFPQVDPGGFCLPEARVGTWGGFVFVNLDPAAPPLEDYLGVLPSHFTDWPLEDRYKSAHAVRTVACNWKVALEAFIESYHTVAVHPQLLRTTGDSMTEYDMWGANISRMITPVGVPSEHMERAVPDEEIIRLMFSTGDGEAPPGASARHVIADTTRRTISSEAGREVPMSDAEAVDAVEYFVFPNFMPWPSYTTPLVYRFRPNGNDPESSIVDIMILQPVPASGRPPAAKPTVLQPGETFLDAPELGYIGRILNQDFSTLPRVQRGLRASVRKDLTLAHYQESRIRHFHATLTAYIGS
ncbi:MAG TPA: aromatic ring-hydroxylating dioxygenase subunit alpha [Acidimicrobiales bacterium]|nr:aromatic ring-hydroxylating dioxygenase subunit alpha [Acidimicrobiales bacterium]